MTLRDPRFDDTVYLVAATSTEQFFLWKENHERVRWEEDSYGFFREVGKFGGMPVCVTGFFARINGCRVAFYDGTSMAVHYGMVEEWVRSQAPNAEHCDAMNFHNCIHHINRLNEGTMP